MDTWWMLPVSILASLGTGIAAVWIAVRSLAGTRLARDVEGSGGESAPPPRRRNPRRRAHH